MTASAGKVIRLSEPDYCYGQGPITIRLDHIDRENPVHYDGEIWFHVEGVQIGSSGSEIGRRAVMVRARRLPL